MEEIKDQQSSIRQKYEEYQKLVAFANRKIIELQSQCFHPKKRHDVNVIFGGYCGHWITCADCGKYLDHIAGTPEELGYTESKSWIEE